MLGAAKTLQADVLATEEQLHALEKLMMKVADISKKGEERRARAVRTHTVLLPPAPTKPTRRCCTQLGRRSTRMHLPTCGILTCTHPHASYMHLPT